MYPHTPTNVHAYILTAQVPANVEILYHFAFWGHCPFQNNDHFTRKFLQVSGGHLVENNLRLLTHSGSYMIKYLDFERASR